jgi:hypothetical protein
VVQSYRNPAGQQATIHVACAAAAEA